MPSYNALESGVATSRPVELYEFTIESTVYRYTSGQSDRDFGGNTFNAESISRSTLVAASEAKSKTVQITLPTTNSFIANYLGTQPTYRASVRIFRLQRDETPSVTTTTLIFAGRIQALKFVDDSTKAELTALTIEAFANRHTPLITYAGQCQNTLYGVRCKVNEDDFKITTTVISVDGVTVRVSGADAYADGYFNGGYIRALANREPRLILDHVGEYVTVLVPFFVDVEGQSVDVSRGCDHDVFGDCGTVFGNVKNYQGFPFSPTRNIFTDGVT